MLALREIRRAKLRFSLLTGAVGLLVFLILFQQALLDGLVTSFIGAVKNQDSPVLVFNDQARRNVEGSFLFPETVAAVAAVDGVARSNEIGENTFTVRAGGEDRDAVIFGYPLDGLGAPTTLVEGRYPEGPGEAVASSADRDKGFDLGDQVVVLGEGEPTITVVGLAENVRWSVAPTLFTSYATFEEARRAQAPDAPVVLPSLVAVAPADGVTPQQLADRITAEVDGAEALTRQQAADENPGVQGVRQSFNIVLGLVFLVVALVVGFFFLILTVQKAKSLTLLRAIGARRRYLAGNLLVQILLVLAGGMAVGVALTVAAGGSAGDVSADLDPALVVPTLVGVAVLSLIGGLVSLVRVLRIDPIRATTSVGRDL